MSNRPRGALNQTHLDKALRLCDALDDHPELWAGYYGESIRQYFEDTKVTLAYYQEQIENYSGHQPINRFGNPMTRRGRNANCKRRAWDTREHVCEDCGMDLTWAIAVAHHRKEVAEGGDDSPENLELLCANCHAERHSGKL